MDPTLSRPDGETAPTRPTTAEPPLHRVVVAVGVALLSATVLLSASYTRGQEDIDWSNYSMGLLSTAGLLGVAVVAWLMLRGKDRTADLVAWPGAFGALAAGLMVGIALDDWEGTTYVVGGTVLAISVVGYLAARRAAFVVTAIVGLFILYMEGFADVDLGDADDFAITFSAALLVFTIVVTALGWFLPSRALSGVFVGVVPVVGYIGLLAGLGIAASFTAAFRGFGSESTSATRGLGQFENDVWFILGFAAVLILVWAACAYLTGHVGFRLLIVAMAVGVVPLATRVLAAEHPTWWEVAVGGAGGLTLIAAGLVALRGGGRTAEPIATNGRPLP